MTTRTYAVAVQETPNSLTFAFDMGKGELGWPGVRAEVSESIRDLAVAEAIEAGLPYDVEAITETGPLGQRSWTHERVGGTVKLFAIREG